MVWERDDMREQGWLPLLAITMLVCLAGCAYTAMPNLRGSVIDSVTKQPIAGAEITVYGRDATEEHVITAALGDYALKGAVHYGPWPFRLVPELRFQITATCYTPFEDVSAYPS